MESSLSGDGESAMKMLALTALTAVATAARTAAAGAPSPVTTWAGCAGALVAKTMLTEDS